MSTPFLSEIKVLGFNFPPKGWALCNGQLLPINQNQALFSLLGTTYGGDGRVNFALPNLQGRVPFHTGNGKILGQAGGATAHTVNIQELPQHVHLAQASNGATQTDPTGHYWADAGVSSYAASANSTMAPQAVSAVGGNQPHENMSPYLVLNFSIALQGIFPSQT